VGVFEIQSDDWTNSTEKSIRHQIFYEFLGSFPKLSATRVKRARVCLPLGAGLCFAFFSQNKSKFKTPPTCRRINSLILCSISRDLKSEKKPRRHSPVDDTLE
jgi:hypothetical protein